jgi:hypothetical protein
MVVLHRVLRHAAIAYRLWFGIRRLAYISQLIKDEQSTQKARP